MATKLHILIISSILMTAVGIAWFVVKKAKAENYADLLRNGIDIASIMAMNSEYALYTETRAALESAAGNLKGEDIAYAVLLNRDRNPLIEKCFLGEMPIPGANRPLADPNQTRHFDFFDGSTGKGYVEVFAPVYAGPGTEAGLFPELGAAGQQVLGYVQLGLSLERLRNQANNFLLSIILTAFAVIAVGIPLTFWVTRRITSPIGRFAEAARDISEGRIDQAIEVRSRDEIQDLAAAFNLMIERLREYREQVERQHLTLEERVARRTLELEHKTQEAQMLAQKATEASRAKSQFLANMSHEIRTPMNGVLGMTEMLLQSNLTEKQHGCAEMVLNSGEALLRVLNDILDFSKIEAGKVDLDSIDFNLRDTIEEVLSLLAEDAHRKGLELLCRFHRDVPPLFNGDPVRLRQIVTNLLGNAIKFTEKGEVIVRVAAPEKLEGDTWRIKIEVEDTGIGIAPDARSAIFEAFSQADGSMTRRYGGTGLGLAICRQLCLMMKGDIEVDSTPGRGSAFRIHFQLNSPVGPLPVPLPLGSELEGLRLLVVDDNASSRAILQEQAASWGMIVETAENGARALEMLKAANDRGEPCDLAVIDHVMPEMDGLELTRRIRARSELADIKLVMLNTMGAGSDTTDEAQVRLSVFPVPKPVRLLQLRHALARAHKGGPAGTAQRSEEGARAPATIARTAEVFEGSVLLAEDNHLNQKFAVAMLQSLGMEDIDVVANGQEALDALEHKSYSLILMDCQMPGMDGYEATKRIRRNESRSMAEGVMTRIPIVALTAHAMERDRETCIAAGMDDYLSKPFNSRQMRALLGRWLPRLNQESAASCGRAGEI
ncbi:MAG: response regulator [Desulfobacteraceae bacterium]|nr:response regulator [Desulfobacteraceae bacterium]